MTRSTILGAASLIAMLATSAQAAMPAAGETLAPADQQTFSYNVID